MTEVPISRIVALDYGARRVGVASANTMARLPSPLGFITNDEQLWDNLRRLLDEERPSMVVVGLPRNLNGQETAQSQTIREFIAAFTEHFDVPVVTQDETLTSRKAEQELQQRGRQFGKGDIDALAATYILEDYLRHGRVDS